MTDSHKKGLAAKTNTLLAYIIDFYRRNHYGPTFSEVMTDLGWSSKSLVDYHVTQLERRGLVERVPYHPRSLKPTQLAQGVIQ